MAPSPTSLMPLPYFLRNQRPQCVHIRYKQSRQFSLTSSRKATAAMKASMEQMSKEQLQQMASRKSKKVEMKNLPDSKIPNDVGLIPQTFIRPPNRDMPRLFSSKWKSRLKLELLWIKTRIQNFGSLFYLLWWSQPKRKRTPLHLQSRPATALRLHEKFYTSLASNDIQSLRPIVCSGLAIKAHSQINYRKESRSPPQSWKIVRYTSRIRLPFSRRFFPWPLTSLLPGSQAKIVSDRAAPFPIGKVVYLRQCVVRIRSLQSLDKGDGSPPVQADLTEYLVMQQIKRDGHPATWKIWGTTQPTTKEEMEELIKTSAGPQRIRLMDRVQAINPMKMF